MVLPAHPNSFVYFFHGLVRWNFLKISSASTIFLSSCSLIHPSSELRFLCFSLISNFLSIFTIHNNSLWPFFANASTTEPYHCHSRLSAIHVDDRSSIDQEVTMITELCSKVSFKSHVKIQKNLWNQSKCNYILTSGYVGFIGLVRERIGNFWLFKG